MRTIIHMFDVAEATEILSKTVRVDARRASDEELLSAVRDLSRARGLLDAAEARVLAELDARGVCDREFGLSTGTWVARATGVPVKRPGFAGGSDPTGRWADASAEEVSAGVA